MNRKANKKADVNWQLVLMIIGLFALIVIIFIFSKQSSAGSKTLSLFGQCESQGQGGSCVSEGGSELTNPEYTCHKGFPPCGDQKDEKGKTGSYCCFKPK